MKLTFPVIAASPFAPATTRCVVTRALPSKPVKLSLKLLSSSKRGASIRRLLVGQAKRFATNGPSMCGRLATTWTAVNARIPSRVQRPMSSLGLTAAIRPLKPPVRLPASGKGNADGTHRRLHADAAVGDVEDDVGQRERLVGRRRQHLADFAPDDAAIHDLAFQADAARDDPIDADASRDRPAQLDLRVAGDEVGVLRIADDEVADLLRAKADPLEVVGRANASLLELLLKDARGDRPPGDPHAGDQEKEEREEAKQDERGDAPPAATTHDERSVWKFRLFTPPCSHRRYQTLPIRPRSVGGTNEALQAGTLVA